MQFGRLKLKHCRCGWMLFSGSYVGKCFDLYGQYGESEVTLMRQFLREGSTRPHLRRRYFFRQSGQSLGASKHSLADGSRCSG